MATQALLNRIMLYMAVLWSDFAWQSSYLQALKPSMASFVLSAARELKKQVFLLHIFLIFCLLHFCGSLGGKSHAQPCEVTTKKALLTNFWYPRNCQKIVTSDRLWKYKSCLACVQCCLKFIFVLQYERCEIAKFLISQSLDYTRGEWLKQWRKIAAFIKQENGVHSRKDSQVLP